MSMRRRVWWSAAVCVAAWAGGCASGSGARAGADKAGDAAKGGAADATTESMIARSAAGLDRVLSGEQKRQEGQRAAEQSKNDERAAAPSPSPTSSAMQREPVTQVDVTVRAAEPPAVPAPASTTTAPSSAPVQAKPGVLSGWWEPGGGASVEGQGAAPAAKATTTAAPNGTFWQGSEGDESAQMRISALALCTRVEGFGKVVKVESVRATGRPVPLLIYTQVDGFSCREQRKEGASAGGENEWVIELGQSVVVYRLSADGKGDVQVKVEPEQTARDVSAFKRRDHYLVQRIELPTPLVSGKYAVKVTVRDKRTGMVDEKVAEVVVR